MSLEATRNETKSACLRHQSRRIEPSLEAFPRSFMRSDSSLALVIRLALAIGMRRNWKHLICCLEYIRHDVLVFGVFVNITLIDAEACWVEDVLKTFIAPGEALVFLSFKFSFHEACRVLSSTILANENACISLETCLELLQNLNEFSVT